MTERSSSADSSFAESGVSTVGRGILLKSRMKSSASSNISCVVKLGTRTCDRIGPPPPPPPILGTRSLDKASRLARFRSRSRVSSSSSSGGGRRFATISSSLLLVKVSYRENSLRGLLCGVFLGEEFCWMGVVGRSGDEGGSWGVNSNAKLGSSMSLGGANRTERDFVSIDEFNELEALG